MNRIEAERVLATMNEAEALAALTEIFREVFADDAIEIAPNTNPSDIEGWDSFNHITLTIAVERRFHLKMSTKEIDSIRTVHDLTRIITACT